MGSWGYQVFCDDLAMDALGELYESENLFGDIERMLDEALQYKDDYIEVDECEYGLVAAALVTISVKGADWSLLDPTCSDGNPYEKLVQTVEKTDLSALKDKAAEVLEIVKKEDSELRELWAESEEYYNDWLNVIDSLSQKLV